MFWILLNKIGLFLFKIFVPPSTVYAMRERRIDPNERCPSCGHRDGYLRTVQPKGEMTGEGIAITACSVLHICRVCHGKWHEPTVVLDKTADVIFPASSYASAMPQQEPDWRIQ